jgi:hypothetical protein
MIWEITIFLSINPKTHESWRSFKMKDFLALQEKKGDESPTIIMHFFFLSAFVTFSLRPTVGCCWNYNCAPEDAKVHSLHSALITHARLQKDDHLRNIEFLSALPPPGKQQMFCTVLCIGKVLCSFYISIPMCVCVAECSLHLSHMSVCFFS